MISLPIVRQAGREAARQPAFLFAVIAELAFILILVFGIHLDYHLHTLVALRIFGRYLDGARVHSFLSLLVENLWGSAESLLIFLFILTSTFVSLRNVHHPLMPVVLTRRIKRRSFYFSSMLGPLVPESLNVIAFTASISFVLTAKGAEFSFAVLGAGLSFLATVLALHSFASLLTLAARNAFAAALFTILVYFVLSSFVLQVNHELHPFILVVAHLFPITTALSSQTKAVLLGGFISPVPYVTAAAYFVAYNALGIWIFGHRDLG